MKITLKTVFKSEKIELETEKTTLGSWLEELAKSHRIATDQFYDAELREIYPDCELILNKRTPPGGLNTRLQDGDKVEINLVVPGGG